MSEFKKLETAQITWKRDENDNNWVVRDDDGNELFQLPQKLSDREAMAILHAVRPFERQAFDDGYETMKGAMTQAHLNKKAEWDAERDFLRSENIRLAQILDQVIGDRDMDEVLEEHF